MASGLFTLKQQVQALRQGAWNGQRPTAVDYLVVAGGGAGGANGGGGGAGGLITGIVPVVTGSAITVTVGAGGAGQAYANRGSITGGVNSVFGNITSTGGGAGGTESWNWGNGNGAGANGGSGGGSGFFAAPLSGGSGVLGQGNAGGTNAGTNFNGYGGGGGAGTVGLNSFSTTIGGNGGAGIASAISGTVTAYAGGGGGYAPTVTGTGGVGGGGAANVSANGTNGTANTGGGGGGCSGASSGNGGSGIVILSYPDTYAAAASSTGSPTISTSGSGSIAFNGSSQYLNYATQTPFSMNTGDFTIEFWAYPTGGLSNYPSFIDFRGSSVASPAPYIYNNNGILVYGSAGADRITYTYSTLNVWIHVAVVRIAGVTKMYVNGTQVGSSYTDSNSYTVGTGAPYIGQNGQGGGYFTGYMSNIRIVKGVGVYTGTFTPSTAPLQVTQPAGTNIAAITGTQTSLLLNAVSGGLTADSSTNGYTPATVSTVSPTWNSASPFATGLGYKNRVYTWTSSGSITF